MILDKQTFAQLSNGLVYSAIAVYALAMLAYAAETAGRMAGARVAVTGTVVADSPSRSRLPGAFGTSLTVLAFLLNLGGVVTCRRPRETARRRPRSCPLADMRTAR